MATGEQNLWAMVLIQATLDLLQVRSMTASRENKKLAWHARAWFESGQTHIGSFEWVCDHISDLTRHLCEDRYLPSIALLFEQGLAKSILTVVRPRGAPSRSPKELTIRRQ